MLILGLFAAHYVQAHFICTKGNSNLIIKQINGEFILKELTLALYQNLHNSLDVTLCTLGPMEFIGIGRGPGSYVVKED